MQKRKSVVCFDHQNVLVHTVFFARTIITSTALASSVFLLSYRNMVLNLSAHVFALGYFLKYFYPQAMPAFFCTFL